MPYVITTKRPCYRDDDCAMYACSCRNTGWRVSRRAVATLDETMDYLCAELKTEKGRVRPEQADWLADLEAVARALAVEGVRALDVCLWRPSDFDVLHARLARGRVRQQPLYRDAA
jgi:hypothetical protein